MSQDNQSLSNEATKASRGAILTAAPAAAAGVLLAGTAVNTVAIGMAKAGEVDPIFAVIAEHQAALEAYLAASAIDAALVDRTPEWIAARAVTEPAMARRLIAEKAVFTTDPTTLAGVAALLEHVAQPEFLKEDEEYPDDGQTLLSTLNDCDDCEMCEWKRTAQDFPLRVAAALRSIIERGRA
jgi:hypothetical protein